MGDSMDTSAFRRGLKIEIDGDPWEIVEFQHVKPGKGSAFVRTRIRNLISGRTIDRTFKSGDVVGKPDIVFGPTRVACFVDGDRWHGNGWRTRGYKSFEDEFRHARLSLAATPSSTPDRRPSPSGLAYEATASPTTRRSA